MAGINLNNQASALRSTTVAKTTSANITTSSIQIASANSNRMGFIIWNNSSNSVYVSFTNPADSSTCAKIIASFTAWECYGPVVWTGGIWGIRNAGSGTCTIYELLP